MIAKRLWNTPTRVADLIRDLDAKGAVLIQQFPTQGSDVELIKLAITLGVPLVAPASYRNDSGGSTIISRIEEKCTPALNDHSQLVKSTTSEAINLHTDCATIVDIPHFVIFLCVQEAELGGDTLLADGRAALDFLPVNISTGLMTNCFPAEDRFLPVIMENDGDPVFRWNTNALAEGYITGMEADSDAMFSAWCCALNKVTTRIRLKAGDCLIINNKKILHGRTSFQGGSRLIKRIRLYDKRKLGHDSD